MIQLLPPAIEIAPADAREGAMSVYSNTLYSTTPSCTAADEPSRDAGAALSIGPDASTKRTLNTCGRVETPPVT